MRLAASISLVRLSPTLSSRAGPFSGGAEPTEVMCAPGSTLNVVNTIVGPMSSKLVSSCAGADVILSLHDIESMRSAMAKGADEVGADLRRFTSIDRFIEAAAEQRGAGERWQAGVDTTLEAMDTRLSQLEGERAHA